jgi:hypothetical protein
MSLEIITRLICDNCGSIITGKTGSRSTLCGESYWDASKQAQKAGWVTVSRGYRKPAHYCKECADKPVVKIKEPPRPPKCKRCKGRGGIVIEKSPNQVSGWYLKYGPCPDCNGTGKPKPISP